MNLRMAIISQSRVSAAILLIQIMRCLTRMACILVLDLLSNTRLRITGADHNSITTSISSTTKHVSNCVILLLCATPNTAHYVNVILHRHANSSSNTSLKTTLHLLRSPTMKLGYYDSSYHMPTRKSRIFLLISSTNISTHDNMVRIDYSEFIVIVY